MSASTIEKGNRSVGLDIVKSVAIIFVVGVHFFLNTRYYRTDLNSLNLYIQTILQQLFLTCIPLFLMATGYLNNTMSVDKKYFKKIVPIICIYLFYSVPALIYRCYIGEIPLDLSLWLTQIFEFKGHRYSWYINLYFGLFLLIPFLNKMYNSLSDKKEKQKLILVLILLTLVQGVVKVPDYWSSIYPLVYFFVGKYFKEYSPKVVKWKLVMLLIIVTIGAASVEFIFANSGEYSNAIKHYSSWIRLVEAGAIFALLYRIDIENKLIRKVIISISKITLDIYLASFLTDRIVYKVFKVYDLSQEQYLMMLLPLAGISFLLAYLIAKLRVKYIVFESINKKKVAKGEIICC